MSLEDYFEFLPYDAIRIKGHRVGIDLILEQYKAGKSAEEIARHFPTIRLEDIYATILYYLEHRKELDSWLTEIERWAQQDIADKDAHPSPAGQRMRVLWRQQHQAVHQ